MGGSIALDATNLAATAFFTAPGAFTDLSVGGGDATSPAAPELSTTGGTSDARFIRAHCPVAELGLVGTTMHKTDECVTLDDLETLTRIYEAVLARYFVHPGMSDGNDRPIGVFDSGMGGLTVHARAARASARRTFRLSRRHRAPALWHQEPRDRDALCHAMRPRAGGGTR